MTKPGGEGDRWWASGRRRKNKGEQRAWGAVVIESPYKVGPG